jgi:hypothetical protein
MAALGARPACHRLATGSIDSPSHFWRDRGAGLLLSGFVEVVDRALNAVERIWRVLQALIGCLLIFSAKPARGTNDAHTGWANRQTHIKDTG